VKLSDAVQPLPRQTTEFVHGVSKSFLAVGAQKALPVEEGTERFKPKIYFMGKVTNHLPLSRSHSLNTPRLCLDMGFGGGRGASKTMTSYKVSMICLMALL
jgi:hypothetical protein